MELDKSYYELLGVSKTADTQTLRKAFYRLSKALHPDTTLLPVEEAAKKFRNVYEAYELLSDPVKRLLYDKQLEQEIKKQETYQVQKNTRRTSFSKQSLIDSRRPLSGGELFSLLLLCIALLISIFLGIGFALLDGRRLQVKPSWLVIDQSFNVAPLARVRNVRTTFFVNTFEPTLFISN